MTFWSITRGWNSYNSPVTIFELLFVAIDMPGEFLFRLHITKTFSCWNVIWRYDKFTKGIDACFVYVDYTQILHTIFCNYELEFKLIRYFCSLNLQAF